MVKVLWRSPRGSNNEWLGEPTPVFLPGESQGRGSLVGCRLWGRAESDTTEAAEQQQQQQERLFGFPCGASGKEPTCQSRRHGFDSWVRKISWRRKWQPTPVFLSAESHGHRSLASYNQWGHKKSWTRLRN